MNLQKQYPKAWADFEKWLEKMNYGIRTRCMECGYLDFVGKDFEALPFEMKLGAYLKYIEKKKIVRDFEYLDINVRTMKLGIEQAFKIREKQLKSGG